MSVEGEVKGKLGKRQLSMTMIIMLNEYEKMLKMIIILMLENNPDSRVDVDVRVCVKSFQSLS